MTHYFKNVHVNNLIIDNTTFQQNYFHNHINVPQKKTLQPHRLFTFNVNPNDLPQNEIFFTTDFMYKRNGNELFVYVIHTSKSLCYTEDEVYRSLQKIISIEKKVRDQNLKYISEITILSDDGSSLDFPLIIPPNQNISYILQLKNRCTSFHSFTRIICQRNDMFSVFSKYDPENSDVEQESNHSKNYLKFLNGETEKEIIISNKTNEVIQIDELTFMIPQTEKSNFICSIIKLPSDSIQVDIVQDSKYIHLLFPNHIIPCERIFAYSSFGQKLKLHRSIFDGYSTKASWLIPNNNSVQPQEPFYIFRNIKDILNIPYLNSYKKNIYIHPPIHTQISTSLTKSFGKSYRQFSKIKINILLDKEKSIIKAIFPNNKIDILNVTVKTKDDEELVLDSYYTTEFATHANWKYETNTVSIENLVFLFYNIKGYQNNIYTQNNLNLFIYPELNSYRYESFSVNTGMMI